VCHRHKDGGLMKGTKRRGVAYIMKSRGPRTEPWGTAHKQEYEEERHLSHLTQNERDDGFLNQLRTEP